MRPVVCATRGGEASRRTQERAIALAKERGSRLIFLYVIDASFAGPINATMRATLCDELRLLGKTLLRLAQVRAHEQGVEAEIAIREGPVQEAIEAFIQEVGASTLVIGVPAAQAEQPQAFEPSQLSGFAAEIEKDTGVEVLVV